MGHYRCPAADDYVYNRDTNTDLRKLMESTHLFLHEIGAELTYGEWGNKKPFRAVRIISPQWALENASYRLNGCLIDNMIRPKDNGLTHQVSIFGQDLAAKDILSLVSGNLHQAVHDLYPDGERFRVLKSERGLWYAMLELELPPEFQLTEFISVKGAIDYIVNDKS